MNWDVLVVGGGPSGSVCAAMLARQGHRVAIVESSRFAKFRIGETVNPRLRSLLPRAGIDVSEDVSWASECHGVQSNWGHGGKPEALPAVLRPYGLGLRVHRKTFDAWLFRAAGTAGADTFLSATVSLNQPGHSSYPWEFTIKSESQTISGRCDVVIEATGRHGRSPFVLDRRRILYDQLIGLVTLVEADDDRNSPDEFALVEPVEQGWWYTIWATKRLFLAVLFTDADLMPHKKATASQFLERQLEAAPFTRQRSPQLASCIKQHKWRGYPAQTGIRRLAVSDGWVATGEALMAFDPLSGLGIVEAVESAISLAGFLADGAGHLKKYSLEYARGQAERFHKLLLSRTQVYGAETRWKDHPFWKRRAPLVV